MKSLVVLFALAAVACGSLVPLAQPPHHPAVVLDPHGRPLDTAEVIGARALHLQAKALEGHHVPLAHSVLAPVAHAHSVVAAPAVVAAPWIGHAGSLLGLSTHGLAGHGHWLKKRSLGHIAYHAPIIAPAAVSHQSRVDVISSPAIVSHAVAPVVAHAAPVVAHVVPAAVSHQSRVDVRTSPIVAHAAIAAPVHSSHSVWPAYGAHGLAHGHLLKKRSLSAIVAPVAHVAHVAHVVPAAVSHQSRVDVISKPALVAAPVAYTASVVAPLAHSAVWAAPVAHLSHQGLLHAHH